MEPSVKMPATSWTCPMHPQIVRDGPASCPICGMALEPMTPTTGASEEESHELRDMTRRFWFAALVALPLLVLGMSDLVPGGAAVFPPGAWRDYLELALATPVCLWAGWPFLVRAVESVRNRSPNMFTL